QPPARSGPEREVPARRMTNGGDPPKVERRLDTAERVDPRGDVEERRRPASALPPAHAPVLDVPRRPPGAREIGAQRPYIPAGTRRPPEPAVEDDRDRVRSSSIREMQLAELLRVRAVAHPPPRRAQVGDRLEGRRHVSTAPAPGRHGRNARADGVEQRLRIGWTLRRRHEL